MNATTRFALNKVTDAIIILFLVTVGTAGLVNLIPGNPAYTLLGDFATPEAVKTLNDQYGFTDPFWVRYWHWISDAFHGSLGISIQGHQQVTSILASRLPVTLEIAVLTLVLSVALAVPVSLICAARAGGWFDRFITSITSGLQAVPNFVACVVMAQIFANELDLFPTFGWVSLSDDVAQNLYHAAMPVIILVLGTTPLFVRVLRADLVSVLREDYVLAARARGLPDSYIMLRHALRPASLSLFTLTGLVFGYLVGGSIILENFFALPGIGQAVGTAVAGKDLPLVQGAVVVMALTYLVLNTLVDLGLSLLDPQSRRR